MTSQPYKAFHHFLSGFQPLPGYGVLAADGAGTPDSGAFVPGTLEPAAAPAAAPSPFPPAQRDEYGCLTAAGFSWCPSTGSCVQPWVTPCPAPSPSPYVPPVPSPSPYVPPVPSPAPIGDHLDKHGCNLSAGYSWCKYTQKCQRPWEEACVPGPDYDRLEPPEPVISMDPQGPVHSVCDFGAPFECTVAQEGALGSIPAVPLGGPHRACVLPLEKPGPHGCKTLPVGQCGLRGGLVLPDQLACPASKSWDSRTPYAPGPVSAGGVAQWYESSGQTVTPMLGFNPFQPSPFANAGPM